MIARDGVHMGARFVLGDFEQRIMADPDVLGMLYAGSRGRGYGRSLLGSRYHDHFVAGNFIPLGITQDEDRLPDHQR
jgi:hypothetical protein